jgi:thioredoxin 1
VKPTSAKQDPQTNLLGGRSWAETTAWNVVLSAGQQDAQKAMLALDELCRTYWYPLYAYIRSRGHTVAGEAGRGLGIKLLILGAAADFVREYSNMKRIIFSLLLVAFVVMAGCTKSERPDSKPDARTVVTTASFDQLIKDSKKPIVLDFWASWCGPCKMMDPIFREVASERPDVVFGKVNVDQEPKLAQKYEIRAIPTLVVLVDGKVVKTGVGVMKKEALLELVDEAVKKTAHP